MLKNPAVIDAFFQNLVSLSREEKQISLNGSGGWGEFFSNITCLGVTDAVPFGIESNLFEAEFGGLAVVRLGFHFIGRQNHVTDCNRLGI